MQEQRTRLDCRLGGGYSDLATVWHGVGHSDYLKCKQDLILCPIRSAIEDVTLSFRLQWYIDFGCF